MQGLSKSLKVKQLITLFAVSVLYFLFINSSIVKAEDSLIPPVIIGSGDFEHVDGIYYESAFRFPYGLAVDEEEKLLYISDSQNHRIRMLDLTTYEVTTIAGHPTLVDRFGFSAGGFKDGAASDAQFSYPRGIALAENGAIFIADTGNHMIRMLYDGMVYTVAGNGVPGYKDGKGIEATFQSPSEIAIGSDGSLYVSDTLNHVIRKIDEKGHVTTLVGDPNDTSILHEPTGITFDSDGVLYIADSANHQIKRLVEGKLELVAGESTEIDSDTEYLVGGYVNGNKEEAQFEFPKGITFAPNGLLFVADSSNHVIRAITKTGKVYTIAGTGVSGLDWDENAIVRFDGPVTTNYALNTLFVTDHWNNRIVMIPARYEYLRSVVNFTDKRSAVPVYIDGIGLDFPDVQPFITDGRTKVPVRILAEALGANVEWDQKNRAVIIEIKGKRIVLRESEGDFFIKDGRSMVGLRFLAENLGCFVDWNQQHKAVIIETFGG